MKVITFFDGREGEQSVAGLAERPFFISPHFENFEFRTTSFGWWADATYS